MNLRERIKRKKVQKQQLMTLLLAIEPDSINMIRLAETATSYKLGKLNLVLCGLLLVQVFMILVS